MALASVRAFRASPQAQTAARSRRACVRVSAKAKLYSNPASRGRIVEWYIQELGKGDEVEVVTLDMREKREHKSEWFLKV